MNDFSFEVVLHPVGDNTKSGDALTAYYGTPEARTLHVIDGGTATAAQKVADFIKQDYGEEARIDALVCTHGDDDHSSGLRTLMENFDDIGAIYMNRPWLYAAEIIHLFDHDFTLTGLERSLRQAFPVLVEIEEEAMARGIPIFDAFQGREIGAFTVMAPTRERYLSLIPHLSRTPDAATGATPTTVVGQVATEIRKALQRFAETWEIETLEDYLQSPETPSNESSVVQFAVLGGKKVLLTADAGIDALTEAADYLEACGIVLPGVDFMQIPHHGSRRSVSRTVLNRWLGPVVSRDATPHIKAYASVAAECDTHPRQRVVNAFTRRGAIVGSTKGNAVRFHENIHKPFGWGPLTPHPFKEDFEE